MLKLSHWLKLGKYANKKRYRAVLGQVAFAQDDVYKLLRKGVRVIYLCGDEFEIPVNFPYTIYRGVNDPLISFSHVNGKINLEELGIVLDGVCFARTPLRDAAARVAVGYKGVRQAYVQVRKGEFSLSAAMRCWGEEQQELKREMQQILGLAGMRYEEKLVDEMRREAGMESVAADIYELGAPQNRKKHEAFLSKYGREVDALYEACFG